MTFNVVGKNDNYHLYEDKWLGTSYSAYVGSTVPTTLITAEKSGKNAVYTFTPTEAQAIYSYYYLEFYVVSDAGETFDFYVSDLTMYKASDPDKKNILGSDAYSSDLSNWYYGTGKCSGTQFSYGRFSNIEWVDYDPSIFKTIFHLNMNYTGAGNDRFGVLLNQPLEAGVKYKVSFNYTSDTAVYNSNIRFSIAGANQGSSLWDIVGLCNSNKDIMQGTLMIDKSPGNTMEYEFTLKPEQAVYSNYFAWFYVSSDVAAEFDIYLSDFKLYRMDDMEKTNLLPTSDQANDLTGWYWTYGKMSGNAWTNSSRMTLAEFVPYGSGDANFDKEFDIRDLVRIDEQITTDGNKARNPLGDINADDILNTVDLNACHQKLLNLK